MPICMHHHRKCLHHWRSCVLLQQIHIQEARCWFLSDTPCSPDNMPTCLWLCCSVNIPLGTFVEFRPSSGNSGCDKMNQGNQASAMRLLTSLHGENRSTSWTTTSINHEIKWFRNLWQEIFVSVEGKEVFMLLLCTVVGRATRRQRNLLRIKTDIDHTKDRQSVVFIQRP